MESCLSDVGDWENDPEWTEDDLMWLMAWIELVLSKNAKLIHSATVDESI